MPKAVIAQDEMTYLNTRITKISYILHYTLHSSTVLTHSSQDNLTAARLYCHMAKSSGEYLGLKVSGTNADVYIRLGP